LNARRVRSDSANAPQIPAPADRCRELALAELPFGDVILWIVGAGLVIYGLFCFGRARYAKM